MNQVKRTVGGVEWTVTNIGGTVDMSAEMPDAEAEKLAMAVCIADALGVVTDVCKDFAAEGCTCVTLQVPAANVAALGRVLESMQPPGGATS
jgi:hypothetical protein